MTFDEWNRRFAEWCYADGWSVFTTSEGLQVQKLDEEAMLEDDGDAWALICAGLKDNQEWAWSLMEILSTDGPDEYQRITDYCTCLASSASRTSPNGSS